MKSGTLDTLIWVLIYGGLIGVGLGLSVKREDTHLGLVVLVVGAVVALVGFGLIYVRSRMQDTPSQTSDKTP
ncbi:MAG: hypothetical protein KF891_00325 [Rhizobacter sp.]|nr:hypothetical protein [Rhizobacter sp.]